MRVAFVGNYGPRHSTENHLALTFEHLGHEVTRIQEDEIEQGQLVDQVKGHDLFFWVRTWEKFVTLEHLKQIRALGIPSANYHLDLFIGLDRGREELLDTDPRWRCDYTFTPDGDPASQAVFDAKGINHFYMKPGVYAPECYIAPPSWDKRPNGPLELPNYNSVLFVGGGEAPGEGPQYGHAEWPYRGELIKFLRDTYGEQFQKYGWPQETIRNEALNQLYADAKVVVGDSLCLNFNHPYYWSDRVYETLGRGGFIIHPFIEGMQEEFTDGENIVFYEYNNWAQLKEKIDYYLDDDIARERIRAAGHEFVKNHATYTQRLTRMLDVIFVDTPVDFRTPNLMRHPDGPEISVPSGSTAVPTPSVEPSGALKISLGAGTEIEDSGAGWVNVDIVPLEGIDVVHNLMNYPWPFADASADYIKAKDIIEHMATHLPDGRNSLIAFIEEAHRILRPGGTLWVQTPRYDAEFLWVDLTHVRGFHESSMDFFDDNTDFGRATGFYSNARFDVSCIITDNKNLQYTMVKK